MVLVSLGFECLICGIKSRRDLRQTRHFHLHLVTETSLLSMLQIWLCPWFTRATCKSGGSTPVHRLVVMGAYWDWRLSEAASSYSPSHSITAQTETFYCVFHHLSLLYFFPYLPGTCRQPNSTSNHGSQDLLRHSSCRALCDCFSLSHAVTEVLVFTKTFLC